MFQPTPTGNSKVQILTVYMYKYLCYQTGKENNLIELLPGAIVWEIILSALRNLKFNWASDKGNDHWGI